MTRAQRTTKKKNQKIGDALVRRDTGIVDPEERMSPKRRARSGQADRGKPGKSRSMGRGTTRGTRDTGTQATRENSSLDRKEKIIEAIEGTEETERPGGIHREAGR